MLGIRKSKKSQLFMMIMVVVTLVSFTILYVAMISKTSGYDRSIGERQFPFFLNQDWS